MGKKVKFNLMAMFLMAIMVVFVSCGDLSDRLNSTSDTEGPVDPVFPEIVFDYMVNGTVVDWTIKENKVYNLSEMGQASINVWHQNDKYAAPRERSVAYSQQHTSHEALQTSTKSTSEGRSVYEDAGNTSAGVDDGNVVGAIRKMERIVRSLNGENVELPYVKVGEPYLEAINVLPGTTKYGTRGEMVVTDSVCPQFVWVFPCTVENLNEYVKINKPTSFNVYGNDTIRVYQLEANDIVSGKILRYDRVPLNETTERCDVVVEWTKKDGTTHEQTFSKVLNRRIDTIAEYEKVVTEFGFNWLSDNPLAEGAVSQVNADELWTVSGRTDTFSGLLSNGIEPINTKYSLYHEKAEFNNAQFGLKHVFDFESFNPRERNTYEEDAPNYRGGYTARRLHNVISTSYLGYAQDAEETVVLLKENAHIINEYWDKSNCNQTVTDTDVKWHLEFVTDYSDGTQDRKKFDFNDSRLLECDSDWSSEEEDNTHSTSGVNATITSRENQTAEQDGAVAKWVREYRDLGSVATLKGHTRDNKWHSREANSFECTYKGKTFRFEDNTLTVSNTDNLSAGVENNGYNVYSYSDVLRYVWGSNIKSSKAPGVIKVKVVVPEEDTFFPKEWGTLLEVKQTVSNNIKHDGFVYIWSLHFEKGVLPVVVISGSEVPQWHFEYFEYTSDHTYNSGTYVDGTWINTVALDTYTQMTWSRGGKERANKDYLHAKSQNWDEGRTVDGHCSVNTSRYDLKVKDGMLYATDTYTGVYMGFWK